MDTEEAYKKAEEDRVDMLYTKLENINYVTVVFSFIAVFKKDTSKMIICLEEDSDSESQSQDLVLDTTQEVPLKKLINHMRENKEFDTEHFASVVAKRKYGNDPYKLVCQIYKISIKYFEVSNEGVPDEGGPEERIRDIFAKNNDFISSSEWHGKHAREYTADKILKEYLDLYM